MPISRYGFDNQVQAIQLRISRAITEPTVLRVSGDP